MFSEADSVRDELGIVEQKLEIWHNTGSITTEDYQAVSRRLGFLRESLDRLVRRHDAFEQTLNDNCAPSIVSSMWQGIFAQE